MFNLLRLFLIIDLVKNKSLVGKNDFPLIGWVACVACAKRKNVVNVLDLYIKIQSEQKPVRDLSNQCLKILKEEGYKIPRFEAI